VPPLALPLDDFFDMSLDNVCVAGLDGYLKRVNPSWTRTLGWTSEELLSRPSIEFVHPEDRAATLAGRQRLREGGELGPLVNRYLCKDGSVRWFEWRSVADLPRGLVYAVARDVTEQREAQERLREARELQRKLERQLVFADRMACVGTLAAGVAHEINNPLAYVTTNINLIVEDLRVLAAESPPGRVDELLEMATEALAGAERIRKIVRGLKTFSRAEEERRAVLNVVALLEISINMAWTEIRHRARLVKDFGKVPPVEADEARLGQVFINLLVNAAQAIPDGDCSANEIRVTTSTAEDGRAMIAISDTGVGIPRELLERIFDPFFTTKPRGIGTGLGLSISHEIVTSLGGELRVDSVEGEGTTFTLLLPRAADTDLAPEQPAREAARAVACASVLVVDDEPAIGVVLRRVLRDHEVVAVTTGREALALLASGRRFDVIFSDVMMPEMSGMELHAELARRDPALAARVVFVSGGAFTPAANAFLDGVANPRIEKPFDPTAVRELVQRLLREGAAAAK
jgi:PAS domain S-box-containing protein